MKQPMVNWLTILFLTIHLFTLATIICFAQPVSSKELIDNALQYDGKLVVYEGEVIGELMQRQDYVWVNISDGNATIGVWMHKELASQITFTGSYKSRGDWVEITGIFNRACVQHGGDLDIHAKAIRKLKPGRQIIERLNPSKKNQVIIWAGILCLILILRLLKVK